MPTVDESGLRKRIGAGELSGLFVVAGEEKYLVKRLAQQLIKRDTVGLAYDVEKSDFDPRYAAALPAVSAELPDAVKELFHIQRILA